MAIGIQAMAQVATAVVGDGADVPIGDIQVSPVFCRVLRRDDRDIVLPSIDSPSVRRHVSIIGVVVQVFLAQGAAPQALMGVS